MPPRKRAIAEDSSSQADDIDVDKMIRTKQELNKVFYYLASPVLCCNRDLDA